MVGLVLLVILLFTIAAPELADEVFQLYYTGNGKFARRFFDDCWPKARPGRAKYWAFLMSEGKKSKYWTTVQALNADKLAVN